MPHPRTPSASRRRRLLPIVGLAILGVGASVVPFASRGSAQTVTGATSLADTVSIGPATVDGATTAIHVLGFNDLHGHLDGSTPGTLYGRYAGGAAALAKLVKDKQSLYKRQTLTVAAGDSIGATPLTSALFEDEPTILAENLMGLDFASVGNHEFDRGAVALLRMQSGGCPKTGCLAAPYPETTLAFGPFFWGAQFKFLASNVTRTGGKQFLPPYGVKTFSSAGGSTIKVGVIGSVLKETPTVVTPAGIAGQEFGDEADAANKAVKELKAKGVNTAILVIHQGGGQTPSATKAGDCLGQLGGSDILKITDKLDPSVRVIVSGHTHNEYRCIVTSKGVTRLITSASSFGRVLTDITLNIDDVTGTLVSASATNTVVENSTNPDTTSRRVDDPSKTDPEVAALAAYYTRIAAPKAGKVVGKITGDMANTTTNANGEIPLGDVIADSQLAATSGGTQNAVVAFMNPGGIRAPGFSFNQVSFGEQPGEMTYNEVFTVQPFGNSLTTSTLTGKDLRELLEQQFQGCRGQLTTRILQISKGLAYEMDPKAASCDKKIGKISIGGKAIDPAAKYRVTMNSFLASGGDGFVVFNNGTDRVGGDLDIDAMISWFTANPAGLAPGSADRITIYDSTK